MWSTWIASPNASWRVEGAPAGLVEIDPDDELPSGGTAPVDNVDQGWILFVPQDRLGGGQDAWSTLIASILDSVSPRDPSARIGRAG